MKKDWISWLAYGLGVTTASLVGFFCPWWFLGFLPLSVGLIYAALDLIPEEVPNGATPPSTFR